MVRFFNILKTKKVFPAVLLFALLATSSLSSYAQVESDTWSHTETDPLYLQPWVWALAIAVITMLVFLIRHGGRSENMEPDSEEGTVHE